MKFRKVISPKMEGLATMRIPAISPLVCKQGPLFSFCEALFWWYGHENLTQRFVLLILWRGKLDLPKGNEYN